MSTTLVQKGLAYKLSVTIDSGRHGHHLKFISLVPAARRPEPQVRFQANLSTEELAELHAAIGKALAGFSVHPSSSSGELVHP